MMNRVRNILLDDKTLKQDFEFHQLTIKQHSDTNEVHLDSSSRSIISVTLDFVFVSRNITFNL